MEAVLGGEHQHEGEQHQLYAQQPAVPRSEERRQVADRIPGVDRPGGDERRHAGDAERREPARNALSKRRIGVRRQRRRERGERAQPRARGEQVQRVGGEVRHAVRFLLGGAVSGCGEAREEQPRQRAARVEPRGLVSNEEQDRRQRNREDEPHERNLPEQRAQRCGVEGLSAAHHRHLREEPQRPRDEEHRERERRDAPRARIEHGRARDPREERELAREGDRRAEMEESRDRDQLGHATARPRSRTRRSRRGRRRRARARQRGRRPARAGPASP